MTEVSLRELVPAFHRLWEEHRQKTEKPVVRIASFNLLVVSDGADEPELKSLVKGLEMSHPCRLIQTKLYSERPWGESTGEIDLTTKCDGTQVCSERIVLRCGDEPERIPSLVMPLIHPGLPTHLLWWKAGSLKTPMFKRLADRARLVLWKTPVHPSTDDLRTLADAWADYYQQEQVIYPLAWFRLMAMRTQIARAYDKGDIAIRLSGPGPQIPIAHRLLKAWLTSRFEQTGVASPLSPSNGIDWGWSQGPESGHVEGAGNEFRDLTLVDPLEAVRYALDRPERDPIFLQTLNSLLNHERHT